MKPTMNAEPTTALAAVSGAVGKPGEPTSQQAAASAGSALIAGVRDETGRLVAPPQPVFPVRPPGIWDTNVERESSR